MCQVSVCPDCCVGKTGIFALFFLPFLKYHKKKISRLQLTVSSSKSRIKMAAGALPTTYISKKNMPPPISKSSH